MAKSKPVDNETKQAAERLSGLMMTAADNLADFREEQLGPGSGVKESELGMVRDVLFALAQAIEHNDAQEWERVAAVHKQLYADSGRISPQMEAIAAATDAEPAGGAAAASQNGAAGAPGGGVAARAAAAERKPDSSRTRTYSLGELSAGGPALPFRPAAGATGEAAAADPPVPETSGVMATPAAATASAGPPAAAPAEPRPATPAAGSAMPAAAPGEPRLPATAPEAPSAIAAVAAMEASRVVVQPVQARAGEPRPEAMSIAEEATAYAGFEAQNAAATPFGARAQQPANAALNEVRLGELRVALADYAAMCARCSVFPERVHETHQHFGIGGFMLRRQLDARWQQRFADDPALQRLWQQLFNRFHGWLHAHNAAVQR